jgi:hypothetical protein
VAENITQFSYFQPGACIAAPVSIAQLVEQSPVKRLVGCSTRPAGIF